MPEAALGAPLQGRRFDGPSVTMGLDVNALVGLLDQAPLEFSEAARGAEVPVLELPWPDGSFQRFSIARSPIMEPALAAQFPEISTFSGQGIDDPTASVRFDWTPAGFHAMVLSSAGDVFVDPASPGDVHNYRSYYRRDYKRTDGAAFRCHQTGDPIGPSPEAGAAAPGQAPHGTSLRTYRLALAATGEYTAYHGGTISAALAAMVTTMNRVNGIYERDLAVRMVLIGSNSNVVYTNASTDPYTNNDGLAMLCQNQSNLNAVIGSANYDIGHVFSTGGGGIATLGSVCNSSTLVSCGSLGTVAGLKGRGVTGSGAPVGDAFDVDYVAHEIGHQFGGNHTFNSQTGSCGGGNRAASTAFEPGSGSTIQGYAGICGVENLQSNSDAMFHAGSRTEMLAFVTNGSSGGSCGTATATGNSPPTVNAGPDYTIPRSTPFALTAVGSDANGDSLTYAWEQRDLGPATSAPPLVDSGSGPLFRSFLPTTSPTRTFPRLSNLLANTTAYGETLPTTTRTLNFRVTVRDNRAGGGGTSADDTVISVRSDAGPFLVTAPNTAETWAGNSTQTVTWNVANTGSGTLVNAANVKISLSTDGGNTFPTVILASTPNDGMQAITVPNVQTSAARIKVEAVGNVFFDVSNVNFTINKVAGFSVNDVVVAEGNAGSSTATFTVTLDPASLSTATVDVATSDGTATAGSDYVAASQTLTFTAGQTTKTFSVTINGDTTPEADETFFVNLSNPSGVTIVDGQGQGTIATDDAKLTCPASATPGGSIAVQVFGGSSVTDWLALYPDGAANSAYTGWSYVPLPRPQTINLTAPATPGSYDIRLWANNQTVTLLGSCDIVVVPPPMTLAIDDVTVAEGNSGTTNATFTVTRSPAAYGTVTVNYATANGTATGVAPSTTTHTNAATIASGDNGSGSPYPSSITIGSLTGTVTNVTVTLLGFSHTYPGDVDVLLVGPAGHKVLLMSDAGGGTDAVDLDLSFSGSATTPLPATLVSGTYKPTDITDGEGSDTFAGPAPAGPYSNALSVFNGENPAGTWNLYVRDDFGGDSGSFDGGWALSITTQGDYTPASGTLTFADGQATRTVTILVHGDAQIEADETFYVNLSGAVGASISDSQGLGTITNDDCLDTDGDRLCDSVETDSGVFVSAADTGTSPTNPDTDGDAIPDGDEVLGTVAGLNLPAMGANPLQKNILLEHDWVVDSTGCTSHTHRPTQAMIDRVSAAFAASTHSNPDGSTGIVLLNDYGQGGAFTGGNQVADADGNVTGGVNGADFAAKKLANFATNRHGYFHYVLHAHEYSDFPGSSGQAELPGDDLIVSLGCFVSTNNVANTLMHELGHNLNLRHGGNENCNWKPNYNSIMNYRFQFRGVDTSCNAVGNSGETNVLDFSHGTRIALNENALNENHGTCGSTAIDWNFVNGLESGIAYDLNRASSSPSVDTVVDNAGCAAAMQTLNDHDDWAAMIFTGLSDADGGLLRREVIDCFNPPPPLSPVRPE